MTAYDSADCRHHVQFANSSEEAMTTLHRELISKGVEIDDAGIEKGVTFQ